MIEDPNKTPKKIYNYGDIAKDKANETPNPQDFINDPYSEDEVSRDLEKLAEIKSRENHEAGISYSEIHEYATQQEIGEMDWFHEDDRSDSLFAGNRGHQTTAFLTSDYDDHLNHIDIICVMDNACSDFTPVPFALDITYRNDADLENSEKLDKKFSWRHHSRDIDCKGFCAAKYFEDTFNSTPIIPKGKIDVMPRFVIGYDEELAGKITEERMTSTEWGSLSRIEPSTKAKFCVLHELVQQSEEILRFLDDNNRTSEELQQLRSNVAALCEYFKGALEIARRNDTDTKYESYVDRDKVAQSILRRKIIG